jgi:hypothetical protein
VDSGEVHAAPVRGEDMLSSLSLSLDRSAAEFCLGCNYC